MIRIFTPSFADESDTNAQNLTAKEVVARLDPEKFHVTLLAERTPDPRISARPNTRILQWQRRGNTVRILWHLLRHVPDVYFFPREGPLDAGFLQIRRRLALRTALVTYVVSGGELQDGRPRLTLARNIREGDAVAGNSEHMTRLLQEQMGVQATTVHDGIDRRYYFPADAEETRDTGGRLRVLFAGSLRSYKRPEMLVRQASRWPHVEFRIAGQGEELERCRTIAADLHCTNVMFLGHLTQAMVGLEMRKADVFFFPSIIEGHPQVLGQAAACGLPVIAMNLYKPDFVVDGQSGFLAASDEDMERKLDLLLNRPELRLSMSQAAIHHARQFDWDLVTEKWVQVFERAVEKKRQR